MNIKRSVCLKIIPFALSLSLIFSSFPYKLRAANAGETSSNSLGEIIASGDAKMKVDTGQWLNIGPTALPLFSGSKIIIEEGNAVITLRNNELIEVLSDSDLSIRKEGDILLELSKGNIRFSANPNRGLSIHTPLVTIESGSKYTASKDFVIPANSEDTTGIIKVEENSITSILSLRGPLRVTTADNKSQIVTDGEGIQVAQLIGGGTAASGETVIGGTAISSAIIGTVVVVGLMTAYVLTNEGVASPNQ